MAGYLPSREIKESGEVNILKATIHRDSILSWLFLYSQAQPHLVFVKFLLLKLERNASLRPPFCFCFEDHELRIIHSLGGEYC